MSKAARELAEEVLDEIESIQQEVINDPEFDHIYIQPESIENVDNEMLSISTVRSTNNNQAKEETLNSILNSMNKQLRILNKELISMKVKHREDVQSLNRKIETNTLPESALLLAADWDASTGILELHRLHRFFTLVLHECNTHSFQDTCLAGVKYYTFHTSD
jgi:hypothetical protein